MADLWIGTFSSCQNYQLHNHVFVGPVFEPSLTLCSAGVLLCGMGVLLCGTGVLPCGTGVLPCGTEVLPYSTGVLLCGVWGRDIAHTCTVCVWCLG